jgi:hypothetical protein
LACAIWWKLECFDFSKVPCTAPSAVQLRDILWAEIAKWYRHSLEIARESGLPPLSMMFEITQDKVAARGAPKEWFAVARTARPEQPDALQGFHASDVTISQDGRSIAVGWPIRIVATRFRAGTSGNPRGRPKGARNLATVLAATLAERVVVDVIVRRWQAYTGAAARHAVTGATFDEAAPAAEPAQ